MATELIKVSISKDELQMILQGLDTLMYYHDEEIEGMDLCDDEMVEYQKIINSIKGYLANRTKKEFSFF